MIFTSLIFPPFLFAVILLYWLIRHRASQNLFLVLCSYVFYGWMHPWFCFLLAANTLLAYFGTVGMDRFPAFRRWIMAAGVTGVLGILFTFKYFNFFVDSTGLLLPLPGWNPSQNLLRIALPVGISFYTFQAVSYLVDVYRETTTARRNLVDVALFLSFFPQLVAGPIERAKELLPQIEQPRHRSLELLGGAWPLFVRGYLKKLVIADNIAVMADKVYMLREPGAFLLFAATLAFALQIYADFSAYTDIARGSARLLGFRLTENFLSPYMAVSPSDFWRRWHRTLSTWIRDYLYIPLGGSRVSSAWRFAGVLGLTMALAGLWHGAAWNFVLWGLYHALLLFVCHRLGVGGRWTPRTAVGTWLARGITFICVLAGWMLFRAPSIGWLVRALGTAGDGMSSASWITGTTILAFVAFYAFPFFMMAILDRYFPKVAWLHVVFNSCALVAIMTISNPSGQDFIYFQF